MPPHDSPSIATLQVELREIARVVRRLEHAVIGEGDGAALTTRVDRLEQSDERRVWLLRGVVVAVLATLAASAQRLFGW